MDGASMHPRDGFDCDGNHYLFEVFITAEIARARDLGFDRSMTAHY